MNRNISITFTILGIFTLLASFSLKSFIYQEKFILENDLNRKFVSFLYDNKLLDPGIMMGNIYCYSDYFKEEGKFEVLHVHNFKNKLRLVDLYTSHNPTIISELSKIKDLEPKIKLNNLLISFWAEEQDEKQIKEILMKFNPHNYPINHKAIKLVLLKHAYVDLRQTLSFIEHHGFLGLPGFFIDGFNAAVRIPAVLLTYKSPAMQKFFQSSTLSVIGFIMTAIGLFSLSRYSRTI
ncbi:hypothetical protein [Thermoanaerobacter uzonensis]|uniref:hypothetical protein n=1 Tax=Thermoanaerobacter uzonensis TaxID=447593 RepID=UPI003D769AB2